jgi:hypothetical protein
MTILRPWMPRLDHLLDPEPDPRPAQEEAPPQRTQRTQRKT